MKTLFRSDFFYDTNVGTPEERQTLIESILEYAKTQPSVEYTNDFCWRGTVPLPEHGWLFERIENLLWQANEKYREWDETYAAKTINTKPPKINYWINVNQPGSRNVLHNHPGSHLSGVFYLQADQTGGLRFPNPSLLAGNHSATGPFTRDFIFTPNDGDLIIFPGWMPHEVEPNLSNKQRINIAFDTVFDYA